MTLPGLLNPSPIFYHGRGKWTGSDLRAHLSGGSSANKFSFDYRYYYGCLVINCYYELITSVFISSLHYADIFKY